MQLVPPLRGVIDRRILVNFRIEPAALDEVLPDAFRPRTVEGPDGPRAIGGICCIRLRDVRPRGLPAVLGVGSENAAHRFGVEWDEDGETRSGVYVPRRDTSSRLTARVGDRSFGRHSHASFAVEEDDGRYAVTIENPDDGVSMRVAGREADRLPEDSVFDDLEAASRYHECGSIGYSPRPDDACLAGVEFATDDWRVTPLAVDEVAASYLDDTFRDDAVAFDNALLMRDVDHEWIPRPPKPSSTS